MPFNDVRSTLTDIIETIGTIRRFTAGIEQAQFLDDEMRVYATTYALMVVSEASLRLSPEVKDRHPDIPWRAIAGAGNVYRHDYQNLARDQIWRTATTGLSVLEAAMLAELSLLDQPGP